MSKIANKKIIRSNDYMSEAMDFLLHFVAFIAVSFYIFYLLIISFEVLPKINFDKEVYEYIRFSLTISICLAIALLLYVFSGLKSSFSKIEKKKKESENHA